jgi:hypothetical protein
MNKEIGKLGVHKIVLSIKRTWLRNPEHLNRGVVLEKSPHTIQRALPIPTSGS